MEKRGMHNIWPIAMIGGADIGFTGLIATDALDQAKKTYEASESLLRQASIPFPLQDIQKRLRNIEKQIDELKCMMQEIFLTEKNHEGIELKNISYEEAKEEIASFFKGHNDQDIGYDDLIEKLKIEPQFVIRICQELVAEGKIG